MGEMELILAWGCCLLAFGIACCVPYLAHGPHPFRKLKRGMQRAALDIPWGIREFFGGLFSERSWATGILAIAGGVTFVTIGILPHLPRMTPGFFDQAGMGTLLLGSGTMLCLVGYSEAVRDSAWRIGMITMWAIPKRDRSKWWRINCRSAAVVGPILSAVGLYMLVSAFV